MCNPLSCGILSFASPGPSCEVGTTQQILNGSYLKSSREGGRAKITIEFVSGD